MTPNAKLWMASLLGLSVLVGCASDDDDDNGGNNSGGGGAGLTLSADEVAELGLSIQSNFGFLGLILSQPPVLGPAGEIPCIDSESERDGDSYSISAVLTDCEFSLDDGEKVRYSGAFMVEGTTSPSPNDVAALLNSCKDFIPDLESLVEDLGEPSTMIDADYEYDSELINRREEVTLENGKTTILAFDQVFILANSYKAEYDFFERSDDESAVGEYHLYFPANQNVDSPIGTFVLEITAGGETRTITYEFDGTIIIRFMIEETGKAGTLNLETGKAEFDA